MGRGSRRAAAENETYFRMLHASDTGYQIIIDREIKKFYFPKLHPFAVFRFSFLSEKKMC